MIWQEHGSLGTLIFGWSLLFVDNVKRGTVCSHGIVDLLVFTSWLCIPTFKRIGNFPDKEQAKSAIMNHKELVFTGDTRHVLARPHNS